MDLVKQELAGLAGDLWGVARKIAGSSSFWVSFAALVAPHVCRVVGCNAVTAQQALAAAGIYVAKEIAVKLRGPAA